MATTLQYKDVKTRKEHQCFSCLRKFSAGTKMKYWTGIYEGEFASNYACETCQSIMDLDDENEFPEGYVDEWLTKWQTPEQLLEELQVAKTERKAAIAKALGNV